MRQFAAVMRDSLHEAVDSKALLVLLILSGLLIAFVAGITFETEPPENALR